MSNQEERPPIIDRIDDPQQLLAQITECLEQQDTRGVKTYILEHKLKEDAVIWDLVSKIGEKITAKMFEENEGFFNVCNRCLTYLVKVGKPKEMLLALLEQMDTFIDDMKYTCFLPLVQLVLLKIPTKLFHSLDIALETVSAHLRSVSEPENIALEGEERLLFHIDDTVVRIADILQHFLDFLEPFVNNVALNEVNVSENEKMKSEGLVLKKHLIRIFDFPLLHLVLTVDMKKTKTNGRLCVEKAIAMLASLETDFSRLLTNAKMKCLDKEIKNMEDEDLDDELSDSEFDKEKYDNEENERRQQDKDKRKKAKAKENDFVECWDFKLEVTEGAQACLAYILLSEYLGLDKYPQLYTREYMFEYHIDYISFLLKSTTFPINEKGLLLCRSLIDPIHPNVLESYYLDNPGFMTVLNDLIHVMTKCPVKDHREIALQVFTSMIKRFEDAGQYLIFESLLSSCSHSGVKGYVITMLKDEISKALKNSNVSNANGGNEVKEQKPSKYFTGAKLNRIIAIATALPEKETSDMLENSDQIISAFNLLRFIVIADPCRKNVSGFWSHLPSLEKDFINPLRKGLDLSEAHYDLEWQNVMEGKATDLGHGSVDMGVSVSGAYLPALEKREKLQLISKALNTHQLMKSLLSRLSELINKSKS